MRSFSAACSAEDSGREGASGEVGASVEVSADLEVGQLEGEEQEEAGKKE